MYEFGSEARKKITGVLDQLKGGYKIIYSSAYIAGQIAVFKSPSEDKRNGVFSLKRHFIF